MKTESRNLLYVLAAIGGAFVGCSLLLGAYGHLAAVLPAIGGEDNASIVRRLALVLPGLFLLVPGVLNFALCRFLWDGKLWSLRLALTGNGLALAYLVYLLWKGVPGHPVGIFLAIIASYVVLLGAIRSGLIWPAK